ncbi:MAG: hypothetical protein QM778_31535 [Myxococcales bacterium]
MRALLPSAALQESVRLFRRRPWATLGLGGALLTSLAAVCCGLGIFAAPWFLCELFALQIGLGKDPQGLEHPPKRTTAWFAAAGVQMAAVTVLGAIATLSLVALGPDVVLGGISLGAPAGTEQLLKSLGVPLLASCLVIAVSVHFEHAPAILIDRGGGLHAALLESARLVSESGALRTWLTSLVAHALQMLPGLLAIVFAASNASLGGTLRAGLVLLPVIALGLSLGQGMVVSSYLNLRAEVTDPALVPLEAAPSKSGTFVWSLLLLCILAGPLLVIVALAKPAPPSQASLPSDARVVFEAAANSKPRQYYLPESALAVVIAPRRVSVVASDGGGVGALPIPRARIKSVRAARPRQLPADLRQGAPADSTFSIEVTLRDGRHFNTWIDEAGVRLDDSVYRRLRAIMPPWAPLGLASCLLWTALWIPYALPPQARIRRQLALKGTAPLDLEHQTRLKSALRRRALLAALWLIPAAVGSLWFGLWAAL